MFNVLTATAWGAGFYPPFGQDWDPNVCQASNTLNGGSTGSALPVPASDPLAMCPYVDPNPVESIDGNAHNHFWSKNPYQHTSSALFAQLYFNNRDVLQLMCSDSHRVGKYCGSKCRLRLSRFHQ